MKKYLPLVLLSAVITGYGQKNVVARDSVVRRIIYRDTIIYKQFFKHDTVHIRHFVFSDTVKTDQLAISKSNDSPARKKHLINPNNWGIGPSVGAYYSPFNGFDVNIGFGVQYYLLAIPSFRNPHLGHRRKK